MTAVTVDTLDVTPQQKTHLLGQVIHEYRRRRALGHSPVVAAAFVRDQYAQDVAFQWSAGHVVNTTGYLFLAATDLYGQAWDLNNRHFARHFARRDAR